MGIDSGNAATAVTVRTGDDGPNDVEIDLEKSAFNHDRLESPTVLVIDEKLPAELPRPVAEPDELPFSKARLVSLVVTLTGAAFLNTLGVLAAVLLLPSIGEALYIPDSRQQWIVSAYSLTFGCFLLICGRIADVYGKRLVFICGSAWFTVVSIAIPFAPNEIAIDVLRALQGLGAAANVPTALGILGQTFPPGKAKNFAFAFYGAGAPLGNIFGTFLSGLIGQYANWQWVFWVLALLAATITLAGALVIPKPPAQDQNYAKKLSVDWIGGFLITVGLIALMFALTEGNVVGWSTPWIPVLIVLSFILIALFVLWQWYLENRTDRQPLMKISIWKNIRFCAAMIIMTLSFASFHNYLVFTTYFFQNYLGLSLIQTLTRFIPTGVVGIMTAFATGYLLSRVRGNHILMFGTFCIAVASLVYAVPIPPSTSYWAYSFPAMCLCAFGADTVYPTLTLFTAQSLPSTDQALGGALINAVGQIGRAIGLAVATAVETAVIADEKGVDVTKVGSKGHVREGDEALLSGLRAASWFDFACAITAFMVVFIAFRGAGKVGAHKK